MTTINGTSRADQLVGTNNPDTIQGFGGNDSLDGRGGADSLFGGAGLDTLQGGAGDDLLDGGSNSDTVSYSASPTGVKVDLYGGSALDGWGDFDTIRDIGNATGSPFDDLLAGNNNDNLLRGGGGNDTFSSSALPESTGGNDTFDGGAGSDTAIVTDGGTADLAAGRLTYPSGQTITLISIENLTAGSQSGDMTLLGDNGANTLTGGFGENYLAGRGGNDTLFAWGVYGDATLDGGDGNDTLRVAAGDDLLLGGRGDDLLIPGSGNNTLDGGDGSDTVSYRGHFTNVTIDLAGGQAQHEGATDTITSIGNAIASPGDDVVIGNANVNRLEGGPGRDTLTGGGAGDSFVFNTPSEGGDVVTDFSHGSDRIGVSRAGFGLESLSAGTLPAAQFATGAATNAQQHFLYAPSTGDLSFDADGNGSSAATFLVHLGVPVVSAGDIFLF